MCFLPFFDFRRRRGLKVKFDLKMSSGFTMRAQEDKQVKKIALREIRMLKVCSNYTPHTNSWLSQLYLMLFDVLVVARCRHVDCTMWLEKNLRGVAYWHGAYFGQVCGSCGGNRYER
jgi:hypothetical protein